MRRPSFVCLLVFNMVAAIAAELPAQAPTPESIARRRFNQVFVKVIMPVTSRTPKQDGPVVESWVAEQLKQLGESEYFAVTDWVSVCDGLLADDIVDNDVWRGGKLGDVLYCPVGADIPERAEGRIKVLLVGWSPGGARATASLTDEPGSRAIAAVEQLKTEQGMPYVAVFIGPPPQKPAVVDHKK